MLTDSCLLLDSQTGSADVFEADTDADTEIFERFKHCTVQEVVRFITAVSILPVSLMSMSLQHT